MPRKTDALERLEGWLGGGLIFSRCVQIYPQGQFIKIDCNDRDGRSLFGVGDTLSAAIHAALGRAKSPKVAGRRAEVKR
jgi:hydroxymethylpyrimidine/phosphomethylpyrimidine kinase